MSNDPPPRRIHHVPLPPCRPPHRKRLVPFEPEPIGAGGQELTFAKSKRTYKLKKVETELRESKKRELYASMSDPAAGLTKPEPDSTVRAQDGGRLCLNWHGACVFSIDISANRHR